MRMTSSYFFVTRSNLTGAYDGELSAWAWATSTNIELGVWE